MVARFREGDRLPTQRLVDPGSNRGTETVDVRVTEHEEWLAEASAALSTDPEMTNVVNGFN